MTDKYKLEVIRDNITKWICEAQVEQGDHYNSFISQSPDGPAIAAYVERQVKTLIDHGHIY